MNNEYDDGYQDEDADYVDENEILELPKDNVKEMLQYLFNNTKWGESCEGVLVIEKREWDTILKDFKKKFIYNELTKCYDMRLIDLYNFINDQITNLVENTFLSLSDQGIAQLCASENGELTFRLSDKGKEFLDGNI